MRKIKEVIRLKWACNLSHRQVSGATGVGLGTITRYLQLASSAGLDWEAVQALPQDELRARLQGQAVVPTVSTPRLEPDYAVMHRELGRKGVTLQLLWEEYVAGNPGLATYRYTQFCQTLDPTVTSRYWVAPRRTS